MAPRFDTKMNVSIVARRPLVELNKGEPTALQGLLSAVFYNYLGDVTVINVIFWETYLPLNPRYMFCYTCFKLIS